MKVTQPCLTLWNPVDYTVHGILQARIREWVAVPFSRRSSQPRDWTQVSHIAGRFFYQLSHQGSPRILEWVAYPFSSRSSQPRNGTGISCIAGGFFTSWAIGKALSTGEDFITTDINLCWIALMFRICAFFCPQDDCIVRAELRRAYWKKDQRNQRIKRPSCPSIKKQRGRHQAQPAQKL